MGVETRRVPIGLQPVEFEEAGQAPSSEDDGFWSDLADTYNLGWLGATRTGYGRLFERNSNARNPDFNWWDNIPTGFEEYADAYAGSENLAEIDYITSRIEAENASRGRLAQNSAAANLGYGLVAGVFDPINVIGGPALRGVGFLRGASRGALAIGTVNAGTEVLRHQFSPTSTIGETAVNIGFGYAVAGLIGGGIGHFTRNTPGGTANLTRAQRARAEASGNSFAEVVNAVDGLAVVDEIDFNGQGVRIIDGPTGKVDASGNPVRAFYRSRETLAEYRHRERVGRGVDDALGDVIPGERPDVEIDPGRFDRMGEESVGARVDEIDEASDAALPFGDRAEPGSGTARAGDDADLEDTIYVDTAAVRASFPEKPWTRPRYKGIRPLPEDAFKTEAEWLNFTVLHELHHATTKRLDGESVANYENRINQLALEDVQGGRLPLSPTDSTAEKVLLAPTPIGTVMRLAPRNRDVHGMMQTIGGDASTQMVANRAGIATTPGGSVFQKAQRWLMQYFEVAVAQRKAYAKYVYGRASESNFAQATDVVRARFPVIGGAARQGKMSYNEFADHVGLAVFERDWFQLHGRALAEEEMALVRETADKVSEVLGRFEKIERELGMFDRQRQINREIEWREAAIARDEAKLEGEGRPHVRGILESEIAARRMEIDDMRAALDELGDTPIRHREGERYFPRIFDVAAVRERFDDFVELITEAFAREAENNGEFRAFSILSRKVSRAEKVSDPKDWTPEQRAAYDAGDWQTFSRLRGYTDEEIADYAAYLKEADRLIAKYGEDEVFAFEEGFKQDVDPSGMIYARAKKAAENIIGEGGEETTFGLGTPRALRSRELPLTNRELSDFIIKDPERVIGIYARRMGAAIEMHRQFGSRDLAEQIDTLRSRLREQGIKQKNIDHIVWEIEAVRDRVLGAFHGKDPLSLDNRAARAIKNAGNVLLMGRGIYSQMVDVARTVAAEGYSPLFKALHASVNEGMSVMRRGMHAREAGEGLEMVMSRLMARLMEDDSALLVTRQTGVERGLAAMQAPFFNMNMMNPFTVLWKEFTSVMSAHRLIRDSETLANAIRAGRTKATLTPSEAKIMAELASWGIDIRAAQMIADMPVDTTTSGLRLANLDAWEAQGRKGARAREAFLGALSGTLRSNVVTPGPLQRAAIMDGVFRWKDKRAEAPLLSLPFQLMSFTMASSHKIGHALLSGRDRNRLVTASALLGGGYVATWLAAGEDWERMTWQEIMYESIDRSGILMWAGDVIKRTEAVSGFGPRSAMGMYQFGEGEMNNEVAAVAGPSLGVAAGVIDAFTADDIDNQRRHRLLLRALPMSGMVWWDESLKRLSDAAAAANLVELDMTSESDEPVAVSP